jgi:hypothetical protein
MDANARLPVYLLRFLTGLVREILSGVTKAISMLPPNSPPLFRNERMSTQLKLLEVRFIPSNTVELKASRGLINSETPNFDWQVVLENFRWYLDVISVVSRLVSDPYISGESRDEALSLTLKGG